MRKSLLSFLALLTLAIAPAYSEWVFLQRIEETNVPSIELIEFTTAEFDDYIIVIDRLEAENTNYNISFQIGVHDGIHPINWLSSYTGGITTFQAGATEIVSTISSPLGVPVTCVDTSLNACSGELRLFNTGTVGFSSSAVYGPLCLYGNLLLGDSCSAIVSGTFNGAGPINCIRFISENPLHTETAIAKAAITVYGLRQTAP